MNVVVCGSDGDIGRSIVKYFDNQAIKVIGLSSKGLYTDGLIKSYCLDLTDANKLEKISREFNSPTCVVNAAGFYRKTLEIGNDTEVYFKNFHIANNILSIFTPKMIEMTGRIITLSSIDGIYPNVNSFTYSIAKSSVNTLVKLYQKKYRETSLNFDLICTGAVNTKMRSDKDEDKTRLIQPEDIAKLCFMLHSLNPSIATEEIVLYPKSFIYTN